MNVSITLGNWLNNDGTISKLLEKRLNMTKELLDNGLVEYAILSGGIANVKAGISEAEAMYNYMIKIGVDKDKLLLEKESHTTNENFKFSMPIALKYNPSMIYIVSSNEHFTYYTYNPLSLATRQLNAIVPFNDIRLVIYTDTMSHDRL